MKYPIGQQDFANIIQDGFVYVDKTDLIYHLVNDNKYIFLARPRRFGKSLLLSTIKYYFEGRKELFKGLAIGKLERDWKTYPVFLLSVARINSSSHQSLKALLNQQFSVWEEELGIKNENSDFGSRFSTILIESYKKTGQRAVILVDEYDNPLINILQESKREVHEANRELLKSIYSNLKDFDSHIRFAMLTGVTRFSKMTIFSGLNNLQDITFDNDYAAICGITQEELISTLAEGIKDIAEEYDLSFDQMVDQLKENYDGYHFSAKSPDIYNPFSLLNALKKRQINPYWFETATPEFLVDKIKKSSQSFAKIFSDNASEKTLAASDTSFSSPVSLLYQTGYLTIKNYDREIQKYSLKVPNLEVSKNLFPYLLSNFVGKTEDEASDEAKLLGEFLKNGEPEEFLYNLKIFLAGMPYDIVPALTERYFQHTLYLLFRSIPLKVEAEKKTSFGRIDMRVLTSEYIYILELKMDKSAEEALKQIEEKEYALPYLNSSKKIFCIGLNFSSQTRNLDSWIIK